MPGSDLRTAEYLSLDRFSHTYHKFSRDPLIALTDVSIPEIRRGDIVCVVGPNGAGKSTLIKRLAGILEGAPDGGVIRLADGSEILPGEDRQRKYLYVPQTPREGLVPALTVEENIAVRRIATGSFSRKLAVTDELRSEIVTFLHARGFEWLAQRAGDSVEDLSGGQQQIVNVLSVLFAEPELVLLDEPTSRLDEVHRLLIWNLVLVAAKEHGATVICATHDYSMARRIADRVVHLENGRVVGSEEPDAVGEGRFVGAIRVFKLREEAVKWSAVRPDWWRPLPGYLFSSGYYEGDDSIGGYLAGEHLSRPARTRREVNSILTLLEAEPRHLVLDVPCGWGRHSNELARLGFRAVGIDLNQGFLRRARSTGVSGSGKADFVTGDMRSLPLPDESVDRIVNLWTSFGYFSDAREDLLTLKEWHRVLRHGGRVLVHTDHNPRRIYRGIFDEPPRRKLWNGGNLSVLEYYCEEDRRVYGKWSVDGETAFGPHGYSMRIYSDDEWRNMAKQIGFHIERFLGSLDAVAQDLTERDQEFVMLMAKL